ncbi:MAG: response regulator transcription factor [Sphingobacteriaceae bacterium]
MSAKTFVLLAEDESALAHIIRESLEERDFSVVLCADGKAALLQYEKNMPDIIILDIMMPIMDGFMVAKEIRKNDKQTPIIFLTARTQAKDVVAGFELGANDFLKKPFSVEELIVRMRVQLNRDKILQQSNVINQELFQIGEFSFNSRRNLLELGIHTKQLTSRESEVLTLLCRHQQKVLKRDTLLIKIWGNNNLYNARSLDVFITKLRRHLTDDPAVQIINIRGIGYKLVF